MHAVNFGRKAFLHSGYNYQVKIMRIRHYFDRRSCLQLHEPYRGDAQNGLKHYKRKRRGKNSTKKN